MHENYQLQKQWSTGLPVAIGKDDEKTSSDENHLFFQVNHYQVNH